MAKGKTKYPLSIVVTALDKASAPMRTIRKKIDDVMAPAKRLRGALRLEYSASGIPKILKGMGRVKDTMFGVVRAVGSLITKFSIVGTAAAAGAFAIVRSYAMAGDEIAKASLRLGIGTEKLQLWRYAADASGIELELFNASMLTAVRQSAQAAAGFGPAAEAFDILGISALDATGKVRNMESLLPEIADKLALIESAGVRNAIASQIFGEEGVRMVQMLADGSSGLAKMEARGKKLGAVMDQAGTKSSERFTAAVADLGVVLKSIRDIIASALIPVFSEFFEGLSANVIANRERLREFVRSFMTSLPERIEVIRANLKEFWASIHPVLQRLKGLWEWLKKSENRATAMGVAVAAMGAILLGPTVAAIASVGVALVGLSATILATPFGWIVAAIGGVVAGIVWLGDNWDWLGDKIDSVVSWIQDKLTGLRDWAAGIFEDIGGWITGIFGGGGELEVSVSGTERLRDEVQRGAPGRGAPDPDAILSGRPGGAAPPSMPTEVRVRFDNVPPGVSVDQERRGDAPLTVDVGHALPEVAL